MPGALSPEGEWLVAAAGGLPRPNRSATPLPSDWAMAWELLVSSTTDGRRNIHLQPKRST